MNKLSNPFFSIVITTYNRSNFILKAINSVLEQSFIDFELIVVDDCSQDTTLEILESIEDFRYTYYKNEVNMERCYSRNFAINHAKGKYILVLDSDDYFESTHLMEWYEFIKMNNFPNKLLFSNKKYYDLKNSKFSSLDLIYNKVNPICFFFTNSIIPGQVCVPTQLAKDFPYIQEMVPFEDTELWMRIALKNEVLYSDKITSYVYVEHQFNSVNVALHNVYLSRYHVIKKVLSTKEYDLYLTNQLVSEIKNKCLLGIVTFHQLNSNSYIQLYWILFSIFKYPKLDFKHKIYLIKECLLNLV